MAHKIFRTGNSTAVSLPADVLEAVGLKLGDEVTILVDPEQSHIILTPATLPGERPDLLERVDRFVENYQPALKALAQDECV